MKNIFLFIIFITILLLFILKNNEYFKDKLKLAIHSVFILKENIPFLEDWIIYHKKIGFKQFYLYDNTGSIGRNGSTKNINKRNINFNKLVNLNDYELKKILNNLLIKYPEITYIKWQPKNNNNEIIYGYNDSIKHYIQNYKNKNDWTAFIDMDEFIFLDNENSNINNFILDKNVSKLIINQVKMTERFCSKNNIFDINDSIELYGKNWAPKNIIKNNDINLNKIINMHNIGITNNKIYNCKNDLYFFHYNINPKSINFIKKYLNKSKLKFIKNNKMKNFINKNNIIKNKTKYIDEKYFKDNYETICHNFN